jgi:putative redox protein
MMSIMGIVAERHGVNLVGMTAETVKEMTKEPPRRIASLRTRLTIPLPADHPQRAALEQAAHTCPVHKSLHPEIDAAIEFVWAG